MSQFKFLTIALLIGYATGCDNKSISKEIELLNDSYEKVVKEFQEEVQNNIDYTNPYYFITLEFNELVDSTISSFKEQDNSDLYHFLVAELHERVNIYSNNDSLKQQSKMLLKGKRRIGIRSEKNLLTIRNALSDEMLNRAIGKENSIVKKPVLIPIDNSLMKHQHMEAFIEVPRTWDKRLIIKSPDSIRYVSLDKNYIYFTGKMRGTRDSITLSLSSTDSMNKFDDCTLTVYFNLINEDELSKILRNDTK